MRWRIWVDRFITPDHKDWKDEAGWYLFSRWTGEGDYGFRLWCFSWEDAERFADSSPMIKLEGRSGGSVPAWVPFPVAFAWVRFGDWWRGSPFR